MSHDHHRTEGEKGDGEGVEGEEEIQQNLHKLSVTMTVSHGHRNKYQWTKFNMKLIITQRLKKKFIGIIQDVRGFIKAGIKLITCIMWMQVSYMVWSQLDKNFSKKPTVSSLSNQCSCDLEISSM